jgi:hypothetical protein
MSELYEMIDKAKDNMSAYELADYLFVNYPDYADELRYHISQLSYLYILSQEGDDNGSD